MIVIEQNSVIAHGSSVDTQRIMSDREVNTHVCSDDCVYLNLRGVGSSLPLVSLLVI